MGKKLIFYFHAFSHSARYVVYRTRAFFFPFQFYIFLSLQILLWHKKESLMELSGLSLLFHWSLTIVVCTVFFPLTCKDFTWSWLMNSYEWTYILFQYSKYIFHYSWNLWNFWLWKFLLARTAFVFSLHTLSKVLALGKSNCMYMLTWRKQIGFSHLSRWPCYL